MTNKAIDILHLDSRGAKDRLSNEDMHKYTGMEKFNPKSFQSGSSVGFINLNTVTNEVIFAQIRMLENLCSMSFLLDMIIWSETEARKCGPNGQNRWQYCGRNIWNALCQILVTQDVIVRSQIGLTRKCS